jgi:hypothetical protein
VLAAVIAFVATTVIRPWSSAALGGAGTVRLGPRRGRRDARPVPARWRPAAPAGGHRRVVYARDRRRCDGGVRRVRHGADGLPTEFNPECALTYASGARPVVIDVNGPGGGTQPVTREQFVNLARALKLADPLDWLSGRGSTISSTADPPMAGARYAHRARRCSGYHSSAPTGIGHVTPQHIGALESRDRSSALSQASSNDTGEPQYRVAAQGTGWLRPCPKSAIPPRP